LQAAVFPPAAVVPNRSPLLSAISAACGLAPSLPPLKLYRTVSTPAGVTANTVPQPPNWTMHCVPPPPSDVVPYRLPCF